MKYLCVKNYKIIEIYAISMRVLRSVSGSRSDSSGSGVSAAGAGSAALLLRLLLLAADSLMLRLVFCWWGS